MFFCCVVILSFETPAHLIAAVEVSSEAVQNFEERYRALHSAVDGIRLGDEASRLLAEYEEFVADSAEIPGVGRAMLDLARLHSKHRDSSMRPIGNSLAESIRWCRAAIDEELPGSSLWLEASELLVRQLQFRQTDEALDESRSILSMMETHVGDNRPAMSVVKNLCVSQHLKENDFDAASQAFRALLDWDASAPPPVPEDRDLRTVETHRQAAANAILSDLVYWPMAPIEKQEWLDQLAVDYSDLPWMGSKISFAEGRLSQVDLPEPIPLAKHESSNDRWMLIVLNGLALVVLGGGLVCRRILVSRMQS